MNAIKAINSIRNIALASCLFMGISLNADAGSLNLGPKTKPLNIGSQEQSYIEEKLNQLSPIGRANLWASLMDGEVVEIDGQPAVVWTRYESATGNHYLMMTNLGSALIDEQCNLIYLDENDKAFPELVAQPNETVSVQITALNSPNQGGSDQFALYDADDNFLAVLRWNDVRWMLVYYN